MRTANVHEAKTQLSKLIDAAVNGEDVVIARNGVPAVRLVPVTSRSVDRHGGWLAGQITFHDPDWDKTDPALERAFYESNLFPDNDDESRGK